MPENQLTKKQASLLRDRLQNVVRANAEADFDLCQLLYETFTSVVKVSGEWLFVWEHWGFESWHSLVEKEVGIHENTAYAYKKVWEVFGIELAGTWDMSEILPITKMRLLSIADINSKNVKSWFKKAQRMSCCELQAEVYNTEVQHTLAIKVTKKELRDINKALESARKEYEEPNRVPRGELLANIVREWTALKIPGKADLKLVG
jgi:hypothetical protein